MTQSARVTCVVGPEEFTGEFAVVGYHAADGGMRVIATGLDHKAAVKMASDMGNEWIDTPFPIRWPMGIEVVRPHEMHLAQRPVYWSYRQTGE